MSLSSEIHTIFVRFPFRHGCKCLVSQSSGMNYTDLRSVISSFLGNGDFLLYCNGKELADGQYVHPNSTVCVSFTLPGGKGGFGSMLRAIGAQIEKTTNREACRDLSGRRLRDINEEQRLKKWIAKKAEREAEKARRRKERIERLKAQPRHNFFDFEYEKEISQVSERVDEALNAGLQKAKRPHEESMPSTSSNKKKCLWLDPDISDSSDSDQEKNLSNLEQNDSYKEENEACCSSSLDPIRKSENEETSSGEESAVNTIPIYNADTDSTSNKSSFNDDETNLPQSDNGQVAVPSPESSEETAFSSKTSTENNSPPEIESKETDCTSNQSHIVKEAVIENESMPIDLNDYNSVAELEALGLQTLKLALMERGMKCGGNIGDRAQRLWAVRGLVPEQYPKNLLAKPKK